MSSGAGNKSQGARGQRRAGRGAGASEDKELVDIYRRLQRIWLDLRKCDYVAKRANSAEARDEFLDILNRSRPANPRESLVRASVAACLTGTRGNNQRPAFTVWCSVGDLSAALGTPVDRKGFSLKQEGARWFFLENRRRRRGASAREERAPPSSRGRLTEKDLSKLLVELDKDDPAAAPPAVDAPPAEEQKVPAANSPKKKSYADTLAARPASPEAEEKGRQAGPEPIRISCVPFRVVELRA